MIAAVHWCLGAVLRLPFLRPRGPLACGRDPATRADISTAHVYSYIEVTDSLLCENLLNTRKILPLYPILDKPIGGEHTNLFSTSLHLEWSDPGIKLL